MQKVRHSAFYSTALDAYVRHYKIRVPQDAIAHIDPELADAALWMMERNMRVELLEGTDALR